MGRGERMAMGQKCQVWTWTTGFAWYSDAARRWKHLAWVFPGLRQGSEVSACISSQGVPLEMKSVRRLLDPHFGNRTFYSTYAFSDLKIGDVGSHVTFVPEQCVKQ